MQIIPWCDKCNAYKMGASRGKLSMITTYRDAVNHVRDSCQNRKSDLRSMIRAMAEAKGLRGRVTEAQVVAFFN